MSTGKTLTIIIGLLILASLVLIAVFGWPFSSNTDTEDVNLTPPTQQEQVSTSENQQDIRTADPLSTQEDVVYNGERFSPQRLEVAEGTTVTFRNESDQPLWVASNVHPEHNELPAFDAEEAIGQGETYSYTFTELGEWGYHNHVAPGQTGTIYVYGVK